ncbi:MAG: hypothetical protein JEY79_13460 [Pseudodesulfovibrio sp.]|nr:hypothetical protein [Pseudodesulfovibrio sp.]
MKRTPLSKVLATIIATALIMTIAMVAVTAQAQGSVGQILNSANINPVGLAMDNRCNIYTADSSTGNIFCLPPNVSPILLGTVPGTPTALAVDKLRNVFVSTMKGTIYLVSLDGTVASIYRCDSRPMGLEIDRDGGLVIATGKGTIIKVNRKDIVEIQ